MILVGQYDSPYVRRVAVSLRVLGFAYGWVAVAMAKRAMSESRLDRPATEASDQWLTLRSDVPRSLR